MGGGFDYNIWNELKNINENAYMDDKELLKQG